MSFGAKNKDSRKSLLSEIREYLSQRQPQLRARKNKDGVGIYGKLQLFYNGVAFDEYDIEITVPDEFPSIMPQVYETGGRIPKTEDRHINRKDNSCCVCVPDEWRVRTGQTIREFFEGPVRGFFLSQSKFERDGTWPFGERSHGYRGILEGYGAILEHIADNPAKIRRCLELLQNGRLSWEELCPCGSGKKLAQCHLLELAHIQHKVNPAEVCKVLSYLQDELIVSALPPQSTHGSAALYQQHRHKQPHQFADQ